MKFQLFLFLFLARKEYVQQDNYFVLFHYPFEFQKKWREK